MRNRGAFITLTAVITALCLYYLSFTFVSRGIESDAVSYATEADGQVDALKKQFYLDSVWTEPVLDLGFASYTYKDIKQLEVKLGLDLQGGMFVTMEVSAGDILQVLANNNKSEALQVALKAANDRAITDRTPFVEIFGQEFAKVSNGATLASIFSNKNTRGMISLGSSDAEVLKYLTDEVNSTIDRSFEILRTRIDKFGVTQPNIQRLQGTNRIQIELPGIDNPERVRKLLQGVAKLEFFEVFETAEFAPIYNKVNETLARVEKAEKKNNVSAIPSADSLAMAKAPASDYASLSNGDSTTSTETSAVSQQEKDSLAAALAAAKADSIKQDSALAAAGPLARLLGNYYEYLVANVKDTAKINRYLARPEARAIIPTNMKFLWGVKPDENLQKQTGKDYLILYPIRTERDGSAPLEGNVIVDARPDLNDRGQPEVTMDMNSVGAKEWKRLTAKNIKKKIAIVLDNRVYSAPVVQNEIPSGRSSISGSFTREEAMDLANILKAGKMPVPTRIVEEAVVGPTLGAESISQGLTSILIGFIAIIIFMIAYYAGAGIVADLAVLLNVFLILGILVPVGAVLTLPGIAGIVLTIGMAVDANILINERIKEELRHGLPLKDAVINGYKMASSSIWDANITTMIAGFFLFYFGSGPVQGFATTLLIGICTSLFTSLFVTRLISEGRIEKGQDLKFFTEATKNILANVNFDFVGKRKMAYAVSGTIIGAGLIYLVTVGPNLGVDFSGGWSYVVQFDNEVTTDQVRAALTDDLQGAPEVKLFGESTRVKITTNYLIADASEDAAAKVEAAVNAGLAKVEGVKGVIQSSSKVGPTVASDIRDKSLLAVILSLIGIFGYVWLRFRKWQFASGATLALFHDALVVISLYSIFRHILPFSLEIDQNFIAAILTVVGYSVNDTVVIFDRVRTMLRENPVTNAEERKALLNKALNSTLSRTVVTSVTVFLVVLILLLFGGETIRGLSFALLVGVVAGTYSTIFIAIPFVADAWKDEEAKQVS